MKIFIGWVLLTISNAIGLLGGIMIWQGISKTDSDNLLKGGIITIISILVGLLALHLLPSLNLFGL